LPPAMARVRAPPHGHHGLRPFSLPRLFFLS
jgi:hypothetical protein